jgi:hypothetical protein
MPKRKSSTRARAEHCRDLAEWTSDERTQHILLDLALELEREAAGDPAPAEPEPAPLPRALN